MLREITVTADTIDEAKQKACQELGTDMEKTQFEILQQPEKKILGLFGGSPAKVRAFYEITPLESAKAYLEEILKYMDLGEIEITAEEDENGAVITLDGENVAYIIGHRGETLDALQYLTGLVANHVDQSYYRISINIGNYREKREKTLEILGRKLAFKALKTGQKTSLEPMNPYERRIIHKTEKKVKGASSWSEGPIINSPTTEIASPAPITSTKTAHITAVHVQQAIREDNMQKMKVTLRTAFSALLKEKA